MRLEGINSIEEANAWVESFISDFNCRFARAPRYPKNLHRPVTESAEELDDMFAWQELRKLTKALTFRYDKMIYLLTRQKKTHVLPVKISWSLTIRTVP